MYTTLTEAEERFVRANQTLRNTAARLDRKPAWVDLLTGMFFGGIFSWSFLILLTPNMSTRNVILIVGAAMLVCATFFRWLTRHTVRDSLLTAALLEGELAHMKSKADILIKGDIDRAAVKKYFDISRRLNREVARGTSVSVTRELWSQLQEIRYNCSDATFAVIQATFTTTNEGG
jgi:hypothetical protein